MENKLYLYQVLEDEYLHRRNGQAGLPKEYKDYCQQKQKLGEGVLRTSDENEKKQLADKMNQDLVKTMYKVIHTEKPSALCLSGGGIRSATFGLGVLQGLARHGLLNRFDYLSTVSGGGYIGSWLTAWIHREREGTSEEKDPEKAFQNVADSLIDEHPSCAIKPEPEQIRLLRDYSNYLTPRLGLLSADGWTLVATYSRNLVLNWLILLPVIFAILCLPRFAVAVVQLEPGAFWRGSALVAGFLLTGLAIAYICLNLPSARESRQAETRFAERSDNQAQFLWLCLLPLWLAAVSLITYWAWFRNTVLNTGEGQVVEDLFVPFLLFGAMVHLLGWMLYVIRVRIWSWRLWKEALGIVLVGAWGGAFAYLMAAKFFLHPQGEAEFYGTFAMPVLLLVFLLASFLYVGLESKSTTEQDREWWGRSSAWMLMLVVGWALFGSLVVFGPEWLARWSAALPLLSTSGVISAIVTLVLGFSSQTPAKKEGEEGGWPTTIIKWALSIAVPLFVVVLLIGLAFTSDFVIIKTLKAVGYVLSLGGIEWKLLSTLPAVSSTHRVIVHGIQWELLAVFYVTMIALSLFAAVFVNINKFSLHNIYRNRLIRAYLGASNRDRNPNPFTGFDPADDVAMSALRQKPLHVVNMALNLVHGSALAWQERQAESFTVTPLHAGNYQLGYRYAADYAQNRKHEPISLGTAIAISGAAANPNMGYHSSPAVTFVMTLFNLRLGWWLGNPGDAGGGQCSTFDRASPRFALRPILAETFGLTNDQNPYINVSDGGHFENLGLYEMVLRRCHFILVSDAGEDPTYDFEDLGNAIRKIRIDLGVPITLQKEMEIYPRNKNEWPMGKRCAIADIEYQEVDGKDATNGVLVYIKPTLCKSKPTKPPEQPGPVDVYNYSRASAAFPHESTADQWFTESQFESYRVLGLYSMEQICGAGWVAPAKDGFNQFESKVLQYLDIPVDEAHGKG